MYRLPLFPLLRPQCILFIPSLLCRYFSSPFPALQRSVPHFQRSSFLFLPRQNLLALHLLRPSFLSLLHSQLPVPSPRHALPWVFLHPQLSKLHLLSFPTPAILAQVVLLSRLLTRIVLLTSAVFRAAPLHFLLAFRPASACNAGARSEQCLRLPTLSRAFTMDVWRTESILVVFHARSVLVFLAPFL